MRSNNPSNDTSVGRILRVATFTPLRRLFDYYDLNNEPKTRLGCRVKVSFGRRELIGMVVETSFEPPKRPLKPILELLDDTPLLNELDLKLLHWVSHYYHAPMGMVLENAMPSLLRRGLPPTLLKLQKTKELARVPDAPQLLNTEQAFALNEILEKSKKFGVFLLEGITGSGKTEVYLQATAEMRRQARQVLIIVPEIGLTPQLVHRFRARFDEPIGLLHSQVSDRKRLNTWLQARSGDYGIIIGTRSASFTPLTQLGLIIIDEEHDLSLKQQDGLRYSARDILIKRAQLNHCPIVLGSATPSLETLANGLSHRFTHLRLNQRPGISQIPKISLLDIRHKKLDCGLSAQALEQMKLCLNNHQQVLLFLNRRGYAPVLMCHACQWVALCSQCDAKMSIHARRGVLVCHHCEKTQPIPHHCSNCGHKQALQPVGVGTERLEMSLEKHFPEVPISRIDRDTTNAKNAMAALSQLILDSNEHILLGTQMLAKGHHFPKVTLVIILDMDSGLFSVDFRSLERMGALLTQVSGRAGRESKQGHVLLQTAHPTHPLLQCLLREGFHAFARALLKERQALNLPPYSYQALIRAESKSQLGAMEFLQSLDKGYLIKQYAIEILGPIDAPMVRRLGYHRAQLLLQSNSRAKLHNSLIEIIGILEKAPGNSRIRWSVEVDPLEMY